MKELQSNRSKNGLRGSRFTKERENEKEKETDTVGKIKIEPGWEVTKI